MEEHDDVEITCTRQDRVRCRSCCEIYCIPELLQKEGNEFARPDRYNSVWKSSYYCCPGCRDAKTLVFDWGDGKLVVIMRHAELLS